MPCRLFLLLGVIVLASCSSYSPLHDPALRPSPSPPPSGPGVTATFFGNTTILISDGDTKLLVDGFLSRPGSIKTLLGKIGPTQDVIDPILDEAGIGNPGSLDALLIGHAHHDHALDTAYVAAKTGALVMGNESYRQIHIGAQLPTDEEHLFIAPTDGNEKTFGRFKVTFILSDHVSSHSFVQRMIEGHITAPLTTPARFSDFKCGQVFALHVAHPDGNILITTTAGAKPGETEGYQADVVFLGVGFLSEEAKAKQEAYWNENIEALNPKLIVPVHWDNFSKQLSEGLKPTPPMFSNTEKAMRIVKDRAGERQVRVLDLSESVHLRNKQPR